MKHAKIISRAIALSFPAITLMALTGCSPKQDQAQSEVPKVAVATVALTSANIYSQYPATLEGSGDVELRPQVSGTISVVYVQEGAKVKRGQPLFKINDLPYKENYNNAQAELMAAVAAVSAARIEVDRIKPLVDNHVVAPSQLSTARANLDIALAKEKQAKATKASSAVTLSYTLIKAPADGYIGRIVKKSGSLVSPSDPEPLVKLSDNAHIFAYFSIGERDFTQLKSSLKGNTLEEKLASAPQVELLLPADESYPQKGKLDMIDGSFDRSTGSILLRASFANTGSLLKPGNSAKVRLAFLQKDVFAVDQSMTVEIQDKVFVFALDKDNKVHRNHIPVIGSSGKDYLVKSGLKAGDRIVSEGLDGMSEGLQVSPVKQLKQN